MDQNHHNQAFQGISPPMQEAHDRNQNQSSHLIAPTNPQTFVAPSPYPIGPPFIPYFMYQRPQDYMQQEVNNLWGKKCQEIEETTDLRTHSLPLARIKRIMKAEDGVKMVAAEAPVLFAKACEMFIEELTMRAWANAHLDKRTILKQSDITHGISRSDKFDFLVDIVPRDDTVKQNVLVGIPPQHVPVPSSGTPAMIIGRPVLDQNHIGQQTPMGHFPTPMVPTPGQEVNHTPN